MKLVLTIIFKNGKTLESCAQNYMWAETLEQAMSVLAVESEEGMGFNDVESVHIRRDFTRDGDG